MWLERKRWSATITGMMKRRFLFPSLPIVPLVGISLFGQGQAGITQEKSVKSGISENFLDPELKVDDWLKMFEFERSEVFHEKETVLKAFRISRGILGAEIGAGKKVFRNKTDDVAFTFLDELKIGGFNKNYFSRFHKD